MARLELVRIKDDEETVLEVTQVPDDFSLSTILYPKGHIEELEKHYAKTGKPKKGRGVDAIYICRPQVERWPNELLERYSASLESARQELEKRKLVMEENK